MFHVTVGQCVFLQLNACVTSQLLSSDIPPPGEHSQLI